MEISNRPVEIVQVKPLIQSTNLLKREEMEKIRTLNDVSQVGVELAEKVQEVVATVVEPVMEKVAEVIVGGNN